jgi:hypothetical protein
MEVILTGKVPARFGEKVTEAMEIDETVADCEGFDDPMENND